MVFYDLYYSQTNMLLRVNWYAGATLAEKDDRIYRFDLWCHQRSILVWNSFLHLDKRTGLKKSSFTCFHFQKFCNKHSKIPMIKLDFSTVSNVEIFIKIQKLCKWLSEQGRLAPKNEAVREINSKLLLQILGELKVYKSVNTV